MSADQSASNNSLSAEEKVAQLKAQLSSLYAGSGDQQAAPQAAAQSPAQAPGSLPFDDFVLGRVREKEQTDKSKEPDQGLPILDFGGESA